MRYFLAAALVCAIGAPAALALPAMSSGTFELSKPGQVTQVAKRGGARSQTQTQTQAQAQAKKSKNAGSSSSGIHPLVGSGEY